MPWTSIIVSFVYLAPKISRKTSSFMFSHIKSSDVREMPEVSFLCISYYVVRWLRKHFTLLNDCNWN
ncbi:hypothetical protein Y032_0084g1717 [Ancylostoma ceylanicum]|uniref:Uncharacterized protein n=1 Tax=Ancylostoma ceylanicum TaxID=53326 RepID=A0A016TRG5_9BILA|nr:hypothetical protein Y032_0084g1717 [Ancylostoma ceylanicum]